jgi:D-alanyl-D-alanine carboxypeptidase/D-alanyl-D-alanine-endopeptidase (penicillin-binding protein 4)
MASRPLFVSRVTLRIGLAVVGLLTLWSARSHAGERPLARVEAAMPHQARTTPPRGVPSRRPAPASVRATPATAPRPALTHTAPRGAAALAHDLGTMLTARTRSGTWGALVVSLTRGDTLFAHGPDAALTPASTMKTFTAALALERLGPDHAFRTEVLRDGTLERDGTVRGDLVLRGDGDPGLSPRFVRGGAEAPMELLARFVAGAGVTRVEGDLIADATGMESTRIPEGWLSRYAGAAYAAPFSALTLNENLVIVGVYPEANGRASVRLEPASSGLEVVANVRVVPGRAPAVQVRMVGESQVVVTGTIGAQAVPHRVQLVVSDPVTFAAGAFAEALRAQGITVTGRVRVGRAPDGAIPVTSLPSPPVSRLVSVMNRESVNLYAEQLFRNAARGPRRDEPGTAEHASAHLRDFLERRVGVAPGDVVATDGSGLSVLDRVTPRSLVQLLDYAHRAPWAGVFHASLPVAGESETLRLRMRNTPAHGNLHAKTGTTNEVISLAGYATAENGELLAFALLYNGTDRWNARESIDAMGPTLAAFSR